MWKRASYLSVAGAATVFAGVALIFTVQRSSAHALELTVYKSAACGCCKEWIAHVRHARFKPVVQEVEAMGDVKREAGVPQSLYSCHTAKVGGYVMEGHVPADLVQKVVEERPAIAGLAVAGMPNGAPGMEQGLPPQRYEVRAFTADGRWTVYAER